jgi:hypothetical protein
MKTRHMNRFVYSIIFWGSLFTPQFLLSQNSDNEIIQKPYIEKFVKKNLEKTYKGAEKHLDKQLKKIRKNNHLKEATPLEWWKQDYLMTMDPKLGRPTPEVLIPSIEKLNGISIHKRATPGTTNHPWISRGPNDIAGRVRALLWDANDSKNQRVFAGGVTGGLWVNEDISDATSEWKLIGGLWPNLNVTCIAQDPNDAQIIYVGTGEGFGTTASSSRGFGIFKSTDGGKNWSHLKSTESIFYINDIAVRNESGTSVLYVAADINFFQGAWHGSNALVGLLRSTNGGTSFTNVSPNITSQTHKYVISDIEIGADNRLWLATRKNNYSTSSDQGGGRVLYSDNGTTFTESYKNNSALKGRVELACAPSSKDTLYAVLEADGKALTVVRSFNAGSNWSAITQPSDADNGISSSDFTRNQAWYDLILAVNPINASEVIIGGINFFMSTQAGNNWRQISKWSENANMNQLSCSYVHADMHAAVFSNDGKRLIVGTDGGVFYADNIRNAPWNNSNAFVERNNKLIVTQFYSGSISQISPNFMLGGSQDNGTSYTLDTGLNPKRILWGGDGGYCFIHPEDDNALIFSYVQNNFYGYVDFQLYYLVQDNASGSFINPAGLDFVNNNLFTQKGQRTLYRNSITGSSSTLSTLNFVGSGSDLASAFHVIKRKSTGTARLFLGTNLGKVFRCDNPNASSPTFSTLGSVNQGNISAIKSLAGSEDTLMLTLTNYGINHVYLSLDGGSNWGAIDGDLPNTPVWSVVMNPYNRKEAIIATEIGMYQCLDIYNSSPKWIPIQEGMGPVKTMMIDFNEKEGIIMAATHGRGIFTSNAWTKTDPIAYFGLPDSVICTLTKLTLIDSSLNNPNSRKWEINGTGARFVDGTNSTSANATIEFLDSGHYTITLTVEKEGIKSQLSKDIHVSKLIDATVSLDITPKNYCLNDTLQLKLTFNDSNAKKVVNAKNIWFKNATDIQNGSIEETFKVIPPLTNGDEFQVNFSGDYHCLIPKTYNSNKIVINGFESATLSISRDWDTLETTYNGSGTIEWFRNGFKVGTGARYVLIQNGNYHARVVSGTCIGPISNIIEFKELSKNTPDERFKIYPVPSNGLLHIESKLNQEFYYEIISLDGRKITQSKSSGVLTLKLSSGQYIVYIQDDHGNVFRQKIAVLNH